MPGLGIRLHQAVATSGIGGLVGEDTPYWAYLWAGGLSLACYLRDHPETVAGRRVLDLGAGSGLVGIVAARAGARVFAAESDRHGRAAISLNAALNGVEIVLVDAGEAAFDLILVGDVFYDPAVAAWTIAFLDRAGVEALVGDPGRVSLPVERLIEIARYDVVETGRRSVSSGVYRFVPGKIFSPHLGE